MTDHLIGGGIVEQVDEGAVRVITLNRPDQRNAFTVELYVAVAEALRGADQDEAIRAVVLTGAGPAFCAGTDLAELAILARGQTVAGSDRGFPALLSALCEIEVPLIGAVNGAAVGVGATMLSFFDLVYVADSARLRTPFAEMGVPPEAASSYMYPVRMGWQRAARVLLTAGWMSADEAVLAGLATAACPLDQLLGVALAAAQQIAAHDRTATRTIKALMQAADRRPIAEALERENAAYARVFGRSS